MACLHNSSGRGVVKEMSEAWVNDWCREIELLVDTDASSVIALLPFYIGEGKIEDLTQEVIVNKTTALLCHSSGTPFLEFINAKANNSNESPGRYKFRRISFLLKQLPESRNARSFSEDAIQQLIQMLKSTSADGVIQRLFLDNPAMFDWLDMESDKLKELAVHLMSTRYQLFVMALFERGFKPFNGQSRRMQMAFERLAMEGSGKLLQVFDEHVKQVCGVELNDMRKDKVLWYATQMMNLSSLQFMVGRLTFSDSELSQAMQVVNKRVTKEKDFHLQESTIRLLVKAGASTGALSKICLHGLAKIKGNAYLSRLKTLDPSESYLIDGLLSFYLRGSKTATPYDYLDRAPEWQRPFILRYIALQF